MKTKTYRYKDKMSAVIKAYGHEMWKHLVAVAN